MGWFDRSSRKGKKINSIVAAKDHNGPQTKFQSRGAPPYRDVPPSTTQLQPQSPPQLSFQSQQQQLLPLQPLSLPPIPQPTYAQSPSSQSPPGSPTQPQYVPPPQYQPSEPFYGQPQPGAYPPPSPGGTPAWIPYDYQRPIVVHQNYYITTMQPPVTSLASTVEAPSVSALFSPGSVISAQPPLQTQQSAAHRLAKFNRSIANIAKEYRETGQIRLDEAPPGPWQDQGNVVLEQVYGKFNNLMALVELDNYTGRGSEKDLFMCDPPPERRSSTDGEESAPPLKRTTSKSSSRDRSGSKDRSSSRSSRGGKRESQKSQSAGGTVSMPWNYISRVYKYANARLPADLPAVKISVSSWQLICLAAQYSLRVYETPKAAEQQEHVDGNWKTGAKAMVIKSIPIDAKSTLVFAIRGTASFMDWAVNLNMAPATPAGFLDDETNFCHAGFLTVARKMVKPVARRLRQLLDEDPSRARCSLVITGHSAGGAVASLLFSHMLSKSAGFESELKSLGGSFRRVHCITFGAPPVTLMPLGNPVDNKGHFLSFVNEGDPVARADKSYVRTLLECYVSTPPSSHKLPSRDKDRGRDKDKDRKSSRSSSKNRSKLSLSKDSSKSRSSSKSPPGSPQTSSSPPSPTRSSWKVPDCTLSNAGSIVVLRTADPKAKLSGRLLEDRINDGAIAQSADESELRGVLWGDPLCHMMSFYAARVDFLASWAVTAKGY